MSLHDGAGGVGAEGNGLVEAVAGHQLLGIRRKLRIEGGFIRIPERISHLDDPFDFLLRLLKRFFFFENKERRFKS